MPLYGYKISGLARSEKYFEAEKLLDRKLKGFSKDNAVFAEDGSITQRYFRENEDGTLTEVTLVKNITETAVLVFSDIPLKYLKFGGKLLYLRDIIPTFIMAGIYWGSYRYALTKTSLGAKPVMLMAVCAIIYAFICFASIKPLSKNRSPLRVRFIALGSVFTLFPFLYYTSKLMDYQTLSQVWANLLKTPVPSLIVVLIIMLIRFRISKRRSK